MIFVEEKEEIGDGLGWTEDNLKGAVDVSAKEEKVDDVPEESEEAPLALDEGEEAPPALGKGKEVEGEEEGGGITSTPLPPFQLQYGVTYNMIEKSEMAKAENVEMNSSDSHAGARGTAENAVGIEDEGKPSDTHGPENTEWMIPVEEKEESGVGLGQIEDNLEDAVTEESKEASDVSVKEEKVPNVPEEAKYVPAVLEGVPTVHEELEELPPVNYKGKEEEFVEEELPALEEGKEVPAQEGVEAPTVFDEGEEEEFDEEVPAQEGVEAPTVLDKGEEEEFDEETPAVLDKGKKAPPVLEEAKERCAVLGKGDEAPPLVEELPLVLNEAEEFVEKVPAVPEEGQEPPPVLDEDKEAPAALKKGKEALDNIVDRTSADEEMKASQGKSSSLVIPKELNGKCAAGTDASEAKDCQPYEAQVSAETQNGGFDYSDVTDGSEELEVSKKSENTAKSDKWGGTKGSFCMAILLFFFSFCLLHFYLSHL